MTKNDKLKKQVATRDSLIVAPAEKTEEQTKHNTHIKEFRAYNNEIIKYDKKLIVIKGI